MSEVLASIEIAAPVERVWELAMDPERLAEWVTIHRSLDGHTGGRVRAGYEMTQTLALRGVSFKVHWELVEVQPPHRAEWHGRGPARAHAEIEYQLTEVARGTRFDYRNLLTPPLGSLGAVLGRALVGGLPEREAKATLARLKALAERTS